MDGNKGLECKGIPMNGFKGNKIEQQNPPRKQINIINKIHKNNKNYKINKKI